MILKTSDKCTLLCLMFQKSQFVILNLENKQFVISLVLLLLLATLMTQFSLDRKRRSHKRNQKNQNTVFTRS